MDCILQQQNTEFLRSFWGVGISLKGDFLHFHCHFPTLNKGYFCLTDDYNGKFCDLISITEEEIEMQHLRTDVFSKCWQWRLQGSDKTDKKKLEKFCLLPMPLQCNWDTGKHILEESKFKKKGILCLPLFLSLPSSYSKKSAVFILTL